MNYGIRLAVLAAAFAAATLGEPLFVLVESWWIRIARHRTAGWIFTGVLALAMRAALLPLAPIPKPVIYDEFSYLLGADTFAAGRVTNPAPAVPSAFESPYVLQQPTYASKYPPGPALTMAFGQRVFGHSWFGVWLTAGAMCAAICWALQAWAAPHWALLGGMLALPLGVFTYWMDSYWGGALAGAAGALVLGSYGRIARWGEMHWGWLLGVGLVVLANTRLFEGAMVGVVIVVALVKQPRALMRVALMLALGAAVTGWYNWRVTGQPLRMPYLEYERQYATAPFFNFLPLGKTHFFANPVMEDLHQNWDVRAWRAARSPALLLQRPADLWGAARTVFGNSFWGILIFIFLPRLLRKPELRVPFACLALAFAGSFVEISYFPHYAGPLVTALFLILIFALRELRGFRWRGQSVGLCLSRALVTAAFLLLCRAELPVLYKHLSFESTHARNARRERLEASLAKQPGPHLIIVRYTGQQSPHEEWVYNHADLERAPVVWAHDLGALENRRLRAAFPGRIAWLFEPDRDTELFTRLPADPQ